MRNPMRFALGAMHLLIERLVPVAAEAGAAVLDIYNTDFGVSYKDDRSPLTMADRRSHTIILERLRGLSPRFPVLSEEGKTMPYDERKGWEYFWLVDPLDGTKEFIKKNGEFTVNIALIHKDRPVLGLVYVPVRGTYYFAGQGLGAYKLAKGDIISPGLTFDALLKSSERLPLRGGQGDAVRGADSLVVIASRSHATGEGEAFVEEMKKRYSNVEIMSAGSSLKFCLVAEGTADVYPRFGPTMEWDTAAAQCVVEESGGSVAALDGKGRPLSYNKRDLRNSGFIAVSGGRRDEILSHGILERYSSFPSWE